MIQSLIIMFRETLEAALIVGIVLGYLSRSKQSAYNMSVYAGIAAGVIFSILGALAFNWLAGGFSGRREEIFEGITMLVGAGLLTTMIFWMMQQKRISANLEKKVNQSLSQSQRIGLFFLVFVAILREGIESVIFLGAARFSGGENSLIGALIGVIGAVLLSYLLMVGSVRLDLRKFFAVTNTVLILFAAGLIAHGFHELQEAGVFPVIVEHVWDINPSVPSDGSYPLLHENGYLGSILKGLFGYNGNPSLLEVLFYAVYIISVTYRGITIERKTKKAQPVLKQAS